MIVYSVFYYLHIKVPFDKKRVSTLIRHNFQKMGTTDLLTL